MDAVKIKLCPIGIIGTVPDTVIQPATTQIISENNIKNCIEEKHQFSLSPTNNKNHASPSIMENIVDVKPTQHKIVRNLNKSDDEDSDLSQNSPEKVSLSLKEVDICAESNRSDSNIKETSDAVDMSIQEGECGINVLTRPTSSERSVALDIEDENPTLNVSDDIPGNIVDPETKNIENTFSEVDTKLALSSSGAKLNKIIEMNLEPEKLQPPDEILTEISEPDSDISKTEGKIVPCDAPGSVSSYSSLSDEQLPNYLNILLEGMHVCGDSRLPMESKPEWFDMKKFCRGQFIAMKYFFGLVFAEMLSLFMLLSFPDGLSPLIFTGKSDTPFKSFRRYLSTVTRVRSWYLDDIWKTDTEGHKNLKTVRAMHEAVRQRLHATSSEDLAVKLTLAGNSSTICSEAAVWSPLNKELQNDFQASCPYPGPSQCPFIGFRKSRVFVNQMDMAITQFGFVGLFILYPERLGAHGVTDEDMECFVHLWRCLGYALGIEDRYNFCNGDLESVRQRSRDMIHFWVKPNLREVSRDWEHMTRCIVEGISFYVSGVTFEVSLLYLCGLLDIYTPRLSSALTFTQRILYYVTSFTMWILMRFPGAVSFHNWLLRCAIKRAQLASPEFLRKLERKKYPYEEQVSCTRL
ncbi:uncharacterized protein [Periplaneta americana]|uniref:uncharacterized protein n=1 Tax=Periplaneta americana TaxID=6978 RepID=UPI0037E7D076